MTSKDYGTAGRKVLEETGLCVAHGVNVSLPRGFGILSNIGKRRTTKGTEAEGSKDEKSKSQPILWMSVDLKTTSVDLQQRAASADKPIGDSQYFFMM